MKKLERIRGAILGAAVADAASRPLHWIYDREKMESLLKTGFQPEFWPTSESPFYTLPTGAHSSYFDTTVVMLRALGENGGKFNPSIFLKKAEEHFGLNSAYEDSFQARKKRYADAKRDEKTPGPINGPWRNSLMTKMLENHRLTGQIPLGPEDASELDAFCAAFPVLLIESSEESLEKSNSALKLLANSETCSDHALVTGTLLRWAIDGESEPVNKLLTDYPKLFSQKVKEEIELVVENLEEDHTDFVERIGKACPFPGTFQGALHAVLKGGSFIESVRMTIRAGGCNCSRAIQVGAICGALSGEEAIPQDWIQQTHSSSELKHLLNDLLVTID